MTQNEINQSDADINFIFPVFPLSKDIKTFPVDFATDSVSNILQKDENEYTCISRTMVPNKFKKSKFYLTNPSLPCFPPNNTTGSFIEDHMNIDYSHLGWNTYYTECTRQYNVFACTHQNLLYESLKNLNVPLDHQKKFRESFFYMHKEKRSSNSLKCRYGNSIKNKKLRDSIDLYDDICDIPRDIILQYLDESMFLDYDTYIHNPHYRNCLNHTSINGFVLIICAQGKNINTVNVYMTSLIEENEATLVLVGACVLSFRIKSIQKHDSRIFVVHGDYNITVIKLSLVNEKTCTIEKLHEQPINKFIHDICVNPYSFTDYFLTTSDDVITHVQGTHVSKSCMGTTGRNDKNSVVEHWSACCYGSFQQTCLVVDRTSVKLYDNRVPDIEANVYFELPCEYFIRSELFTPCIQWSMHNPHQYFVGSTHSLVICDDRYVKTPIMKINHYMEGEPRYLNITELETDSYLATLTSYRKTESICMNLMKNVIESNEKIGNEVVKIAPFVTVRQPFFKLSSYTDWKYDVTDWRAILQSVQQRISSPCIGLTLCPFQFDPLDCKKTFLCLQSNIYGDLFQQLMRYENPIPDETSRNIFNTAYIITNDLFHDNEKNVTELDKKYKKQCSEWLECLCNTYKEKEKSDSDSMKTEIMDNNSTLEKQKTFIENQLREKRLSKLCCSDFPIDIKNVSDFPIDIKNVDISDITSHDDSILINGAIAVSKRLTHHDMTSSEIDNESLLPNENETSKNAESATVDVSKYTKLRNRIRKVKTSDSILTRNALNLENCKAEDLSLVPDPESFTKPLSTLLRKNWSILSKEDYITLDTLDPSTAFDPSLSYE